MLTRYTNTNSVRVNNEKRDHFCSSIVTRISGNPRAATSRILHRVFLEIMARITRFRIISKGEIVKYGKKNGLLMDSFYISWNMYIYIFYDFMQFIFCSKIYRS